MNKEIISTKLQNILFDLKVMVNSSIEYEFTVEEIEEITRIRTILKQLNHKIKQE